MSFHYSEEFTTGFVFVWKAVLIYDFCELVNLLQRNRLWKQKLNPIVENITMIQVFVPIDFPIGYPAFISVRSFLDKLFVTVDSVVTIQDAEVAYMPYFLPSSSPV